MIGTGRRFLTAGPTVDAARPPLFLTLYTAGFLCLFATHLDLFLERAGVLPLNPIHLFVLACGPFVLWFLVGPGADRALGRAVEAVQRSATPVVFFVLWLAGHVLFLGGAVLDGENVDFTRYFPLYQLVIFLFGMVLASAPGFAEALRPAAAAAILLLGGTILYDAFLPGSFSVAQGRAAGVGMNANVAAFDLLLLLSVAIRYREARPLDAALIGFSLLAVFFTFSRGGLLLGLIVLAVYGSSLVASGASVARLAVPAAGLAAAAVLLPLLLDAAAIADLPDAARRLSWLGAREGSGVGEESRVDLVFYYLGLVQQQPFLGHGTGASVVEELRAPWREGAHNMYLRVWIDHGLWGVATYVGLLGSALALFVQRGFRPGVAFAAVVLVNGAFSHNIVDDKTFLALLGIALATSALDRDARRPGAPP